jgi:16S rRNA (uracil1498-N3)-methyltransferase
MFVSSFARGVPRVLPRLGVRAARARARSVVAGGGVSPPLARGGRGSGRARFLASRAAAGETATGAREGGLAAARAAQATRLHRFYVDERLPDAGGVVFLTREDTRHATRSLRLGPGALLEVCDGRGGVAPAEVLAIEDRGRDGAVAAVAPTREPARTAFDGPRWDVAVACGGLKGGRADWLVEKCAELGAASVVPLLTERSPTIGKENAPGGEYDDATGGDTTSGGKKKKKKVKKAIGADAGGSDLRSAEGGGRGSRWARVARAASKQCLRAHALEVAPATTLEAMLDRVRAAPVALLAAAGAPPLREVLRGEGGGEGGGGGGGGEGAGMIGRTGGGVLLVGPEGDFTDEEVEALIRAGAKPVGLGPLRLRVETAAVSLVACVAVMHPGEAPPGC